MPKRISVADGMPVRIIAVTGASRQGVDVFTRMPLIGDRLHGTVTEEVVA